MTQQQLNIFKRGVIFDLDVSIFRANQRVTAQDLGTDPTKVPDIVDLGKKRLFSKEVMEPLWQCEGEARRALEKASVPFPISGLHFVPYGTLNELEKELDSIARKLNINARDFLDSYEDHQREMLQKYPNTLRETDYPDKDRLRFGITWRKFAITPVEGDQSLNTVENELVESTAKRLREEVQERVKLWRERLQDGELSETHLKSMKTTIERFRKLNWVGDAAVETMLIELGKTVEGASAKTFREYEPAQRDLKRVLDRTAEVASAKDYSEVLGRFKRAIEHEVQGVKVE